MLVCSTAVREAVLTHARDGHPEEVCGVLGGEHGDEESHADTLERVENVAATPRTRYELDPEGHLAAMEAIEAAGREVVGFYHSHPAGPAEPSETDAAQATWAGYSYVVVALGQAEPSVGAWRWTGEEFAAEALRVHSSEERPT